MNTDHFELMKLALEAEEQSEHENHKVGALLYHDGKHIARHNFWSASLEKHIGRYKKLGNASTTVHAEMAVICAASATEGASIYVTDLPCPNCAKLIAEARINAVYIDSHTHNTPLGLKIKPYFDDISTLIFKNAGITVYEMNEPERVIHKIIEPAPNILIQIHRPVRQIALEYSNINKARFIEIVGKQKSDANFAACYAKSDLGHYVFLLAQPHRSIGLPKEGANEIRNIQNKYEPSLQPINRLLVACSRYGLKIDPQYLYSNQTPTAREFVNMIGAGYNSLYIGDQTKCRDEWGLQALKQLKKCKVIKVY